MVNLIDILCGLKGFFEHFFNGMKNALFTILALVAYLVGYPSQILVLVIVLFVLDIITRFWAISIQNNGLGKAFMNKKLTSRSFINGFITKILGYFVLLVIANLASITPEISLVGKAIAVIIYVGLFFYEAISNLENLRDAGFLAVVPLLNRLKREQDKFLYTKTEDPAIKTAYEAPQASSSNKVP